MFRFSQYTTALDLLSGDSQMRSVTAFFRDNEFARTLFKVDTNMSILKSSLSRSLPKEAFGVLPREDFEKYMRLTINGIPVDDDNMFGLCYWKTGKVASSDDDDNIIIRVYLSEGMGSLSSGFEHTKSLKVR